MRSHHRTSSPSPRLERRMGNAIKCHASELERLQQQEQSGQLWIRNKVSRRTLRSGVIIATVCFSVLTFAQSSLNPYFRSVEDLEERFLQSNGNVGNVVNKIPSYGAAEMGMEPSIVRICRAVVEHVVSEDSIAVSNGVPEKQQQPPPQHNSILIVPETVHVCTSQSLFESMVTMYHSAVMVQTLKELGMGDIVQYTHNCQRFAPFLTTVQMETRPELLLVHEAAMYRAQNIKNSNKLDDLTNQCSTLLQKYEAKKTSPTTLPPILIPESITSVDETNALIEFVTVNVHYAATSAPINNNNNNNNNILSNNNISFDESEVLPPQRRKLLANPETFAPSHDREDTVIIYLDSHNIRALPLHYYALYIPRSATNVLILTSPNTNRETTIRKTILAHVDVLKKYITKIVPRAQVDVVMGNGLGSLGVVKSILLAGYLICPPGLDCWIPAIGRGRNGKGQEANGQLMSNQRTVLVDDDVDESSFLPLTLAQLPPQFTGHIQILPSHVTEELKIRTDNNSFDAPTLAFLQSPPTDRATCPAVRGRHGAWTPSGPEFSAKLQYHTPLNHMFGFADQRHVPNQHKPHRTPTTYRWIEDESLETCPIQLVTLDSFCKTMSDLNVGRLFFVGDFVGMNQAYSLWKLLGNLDSPKLLTDKEPSWIREIVCPMEGEDGAAGEQMVTIQFTRNDIMEQNTRPVDMTRGRANCKGYLYCYGWTDKYMDYYRQSQEQKPEEQRTILITSFGPHFYEEIDFRKGMGEFLDTLDANLKERLTKDIFFYRTIAPGHESCNRKKNQIPFKDFEEYRPTISSLAGWDLHDGFNDIAERMVKEFNNVHYNNNNGEQHPLTPEAALLAPVHILDVYPMSILRRDGHISGPDCVNCAIRHDCFHYSLPGPSDWWNHLLFSNLKDRAEVENRLAKAKQQQAGDVGSVDRSQRMPFWKMW